MVLDIHNIPSMFEVLRLEEKMLDLNLNDINYNISVIIPSFNREKTIERCLDSVINQTYPAFEIIVVDDGSEDQTLNIIKEKYVNRVRVISQNHKGAQAARNKGIKAACGEYISFLDSDDEWVPNKLELQVNELIKNPNKVICGNGYIVTDWKREVPKVYSKLCINSRSTTKKVMKLKGKNGYVYKELLNNSFCLFPVLLAPKQFFYDIRLLDEKVPAYQEWDTAIRLAKNHEFAFINKPLFIYHLHDGETISKDTKKAIDGMEYNCKKFQYEILSQLGSKALTQRYYGLMKQCTQFSDKRFFEYLLKYCLGKINIFLLK